ncbi:MAG: flagellar hook-basal body complex protein FliE [Sphingobacteriia bacterium]|nr:flagellar hook-basal body complex protein FliE [Sphingobacteriia bacterium]NCC41138.1 flagellar hook-basal body complex protein FliE [Gammaproteobacteria bacterium]
MDTLGIDQMLNELSELRALAQSVRAKPAQADDPASRLDFAEVLKDALKDVSAAQTHAKEMAENFTAGDSATNLQDVMINLQKASLSFQQMVQVRNRLVTAYQDIMNMPV